MTPAERTLKTYASLPEQLDGLDVQLEMFLIQEKHSLKAIDACLDALRQSACRLCAELEKLPDNPDLQAAVRWALESLEEMEQNKTLLVQREMAKANGKLH